MLVGDSYCTLGVTGHAGIVPDDTQSILSPFFNALREHTCYAREKSIWVCSGEKGRRITLYVITLSMCVIFQLMKPISFIEFFELDNKIFAGRCESFAKLIGQYRDRILAQRVEYSTDLFMKLEAQELIYYICTVFYKHWAKEGLDTIVDPGFGTSEFIVRNLVAKAQGLQALQDLGEILAEKLIRKNPLDSYWAIGV